MSADSTGGNEPCRLGYEEHDGSRYCFAHGGFVIAGTRRLVCDNARGQRS